MGVRPRAAERRRQLRELAQQRPRLPWIHDLLDPERFRLRGDGATVTDRALRLHAEAGEPYRLAARQLLRDPPTFGPVTARRTVYV